MEHSEQRPKKRSAGGIVFLILLLLLLGGAGYLYYSVAKAPLDLEDPRQLAASAPMQAEERFRFSGGSVQVKLDAGDLWSVILTHAGENFLDKINGELQSYGLKISGCGIHMDTEGLRLDLELNYKEHRLVAKVPCDLDISGQHISLTPKEVKLGVISLPVKDLLSRVKLEYDITLPVLADVTDVSFAENAIVLTGSLEEDIRALIPRGKSLYKDAVFLPSLRPLADSLETEEGFSGLLSQWEQDPGSLEALYRQLFVLADSRDLELYLESRSALTRRFFPGIDFDGLEQERTGTQEQLSGQVVILEQLFTNMANDYNEKNFLLKKGTFFLQGNAFRVEQYSAGKYDALFEVLDPEAFYPVLVNVEDGFIRKTSSFYRMAEEGLEFTQSVDYNRTYILGCILRSVAGEPYLIYEAEIQQANTYSRIIKAIPLTEAEAEEMQQEGKFGIWTGRN